MTPIEISNLPAIPEGDTINGLTLVANAINSNGQTYTGKILLSDANSFLGCHCVHVARLTLTPAEILTGNATPVPFGITVPTGHYVKALDCDAYMDYQTTPYATNTTLQIVTGSGISQKEFTNFLSSSATRFLPIPDTTGNLVNFEADSDLYVKVKSGNPKGGDSPVTIYLTYIIVEI